MKDYIFTVKGQPKGKGRPGFTKNGYVYTPESTRIYEEEIKLLLVFLFHLLLAKSISSPFFLLINKRG